LVEHRHKTDLFLGLALRGIDQGMSMIDVSIVMLILGRSAYLIVVCKPVIPLAKLMLHVGLRLPLMRLLLYVALKDFLTIHQMTTQEVSRKGYFLWERAWP
jgi:hypothetical protein